MKNFRIGLGFDIHRFAVGRKLFLGGIAIPHKKGLKGHSDADCVIHSVCDAILGALALGDIGKFFPDTDAKYKGKRSTFFLDVMKILMRDKRAQIVNIDCMLLAEEPKVSPYVAKMKKTMAGHLGIRAAQIGIKATTMEGLGFIGRREGIACQSAVLISLSAKKQKGRKHER